MSHKYSYDWSLKDYPNKHGLKVFSTFACGGGSTMGYKLAGFDVIAANDIDSQMEKVYRMNHHPKYFFKAPIKNLLTMNLPDELYGIDILDGSPPCSVFSMAGDRESAWGKEKMFREGQAKQMLDDLFFDFIDLIEKLKPKVVVAENVKGMLVGHARWYTREVDRRMRELGYKGQVFLLNGATMGIPQKRERVVFVYNRLGLSSLKLHVREPVIKYREFKGIPGRLLNPGTVYYKRWLQRLPGDKCFADIAMRHEGKNSGFTDRFLKDDEIPPTITAKGDCLTRYDVPNHVGTQDIIKIGSFPRDYDFAGISANYLIGMSVPPVMMAHVASVIYEQWGNKLETIGKEEQWQGITPVINQSQPVSL